MVWYQSNCATCYSFKNGADLFKVQVTVVVQWTAEGHIRFVQFTDYATQANSPANNLSWKGRVFEPPQDPKELDYFWKVYRLLTKV